MNKIFLSVFALALAVCVLRCTKNFDGESFAPTGIRPTISTLTVNGGSTFYCSISGGCPVIVTGKNFFPGAKLFVGPYVCRNSTVSADYTQLSCLAGPARTGVFDISIVNDDGAASRVDPNFRFSYASFLYLGVQDSPGKVYGYAQNPETGKLLPIAGSPFSVASHNGTYGVVISPNNKFLYAANVTTGTLTVYAIDPADGRLATVGLPFLSGGTAPNGLFFHPAGNYLYVTNQQSNNVSALSVAPDGTLSTVGGSPFAVGSASLINGLVVDPAGKFLYAAAMGNPGNGVVGYAVDHATGALTLLPGSPFKNTNGGIPNTGDGITIHPNGRWLYMGLVNQKKMAAFEINTSTGELTGIGAPVLNNISTGYTDNGGSGANISPDGLNLYGTAFSTNGAHDKKVIVYDIDQATGEIRLASEADSGGGPNDIRVDTNGKFAYTCNSLSTPSISAYSRNPATGQLTGLNPRDVAIPTTNGGPGIMFIQK